MARPRLVNRANTGGFGGRTVARGGLAGPVTQARVNRAGNRFAGPNAQSY